jgi:iron complex transport system ATP-binding protein
MTSVTAASLSWHVEGRAIVDDVDLDLRAGELVALAGPNGAGKSTVVRLLAGDLRPSGGTIRFGEATLTDLGPAEQARLRAVMPQHTSVLFAFTVRQITAMGRYPHGPASTDDAVVEDAMREADVTHLAERSFITLSGGEQSLATLARVIAQQGGVLLLDEPTASLDIRHRAHVMAIARSTADEGAAVCVVVHDLNLAAAYADRVVLMHEGRKVCDAAPWAAFTAERLSEVFEHEVAVTRSPIGDHPLVTPHYGRPSSARGVDARAVLGSAR